MEIVDEPQELSLSPPPRMARSFSPCTPFIRNGIRYNEFREILNTAVQATQHDRPIQHQPEVLGMIIKFFSLFFFKSNHYFLEVPWNVLVFCLISEYVYYRC